jgi:hypothetical protein
MIQEGYTQIPWQEPAKWEAANACLKATLKSKGKALSSLQITARWMQGIILSLDGFLTDLCAQTCPHCSDNCCRHATIWYDFRDLLYLHLGDLPSPPAQPQQPCRYLLSNGCCLPRIQRPFICLWYLCPDQKAVLTQTGSPPLYWLQKQIGELQQARRQLEQDFMAVLC